MNFGYLISKPAKKLQVGVSRAQKETHASVLGILRLNSVFFSSQTPFISEHVISEIVHWDSESPDPVL